MKNNGPLQEATAVLLEFLEVAVHQVLYNRGVYSPAIFERRRKYDVPVFMSRHPDLNLYIHEVLHAAGAMFMEGSVDKVIVTLYGSRSDQEGHAPLESFAFELASSPTLIRALAVGGLDDPFPAFRKLLARLSVAEEVAELQPLPSDVTFALLLSTRPQVRPDKEGREGWREGGADIEVPEGWAAAISSGEFAPGGPEDCLAACLEGGRGTGREGEMEGAITYLNLASWGDLGVGGGERGAESKVSPHMRVVVRSRVGRATPPVPSRLKTI